MKIFQILNGFCHWDATETLNGDISNAEWQFSPEIQFVEAPDIVREGWGFDENAEGDTRFIRPIPPEGWLYDEESGTFYPEDGEPPTSQEPENAALLARIAALEEELAAAKILLGVTE